MQINPDHKGPVRIFDSRKARDRYKDYKAVRSADIFVPPNHIALVSLIAPEEYFEKLTFTAIRIPTPEVGEDTSCYLDCNTGKRYRRWRCQQDLGTSASPNDQPTQYTEYNSNVVYWGLDPFTRNIVEFEYIVRPGVYFLQADRCANEVLDDCVNPTIIEASLIYTETVYDLLLPCSCKLSHWQDCEEETPTPTPAPYVDTNDITVVKAGTNTTVTSDKVGNTTTYTVSATGGGSSVDTNDITIVEAGNNIVVTSRKSGNVTTYTVSTEDSPTPVPYPYDGEDRP